ncbi:hypothetical protein B484DRAFT_255890 [Ochromonadaceae sp. CCMP2298]|nr:hypothetical protein B484DRAFT_255890 [Ochromonadaceae sp. CCMP2298]
MAGPPCSCCSHSCSCTNSHSRASLNSCSCPCLCPCFCARGTFVRARRPSSFTKCMKSRSPKKDANSAGGNRSIELALELRLRRGRSLIQASYVSQMRSSSPGPAPRDERSCNKPRRPRRTVDTVQASARTCASLPRQPLAILRSSSWSGLVRVKIAHRLLFAASSSALVMATKDTFAATARWFSR